MKLVPASEEQKRSRDLLTHEAWGQRLSAEAYARREDRLAAHPWARAGMTTWLWEEDGDVLASCETHTMRSFLQTDGGREESISFTVGAVYTEERYRGRGYARAMLKALAAELRGLEPRAHAVLLYSEVGGSLYEQIGFAPRHCHDRIFPAQGGAAPAGARWIDENQAAELLTRFPLPDTRFVVWPSAEQLDWHLERARIYAEELGRQPPLHCGVELGESRMLWAADFKNDRLAVLLACASDPGATRPLVQAAQLAAADAGLARVRIWETTTLPLPADEGARVPRDDEALPMILPLSPEVQPEAWTDIPRAIWA